jgi:hypothetical protein
VTLSDDGAAWLEIERNFVDTLGRCPSLLEESTRELIVEGIGRQFGAPLSLRRQTTARSSIIELVRVCAGLPRGLELLTEQVRLVDQLTPVLPELRHLCDEWQAAHTLSDIWPELRGTLEPLKLTDAGKATEVRMLRKLAAVATESRLPELPPQCWTVWRLFVHLVGANAGPSGVPPYVLLLQWLGECVPDPVVASMIRKWCRGLATQWDVVDELDIALPGRAIHSDQPRPVHLLIQIDPDPMDSDQLLVSHWRQWDPHEWRPQRGDDRTIPSSALEAEVDKLIDDMECMLGASVDAEKTEDIGLEFVLPIELLNFPVQHLRKKALAGKTVPLAVDHPIVLRSLERLRTPRLHLAWRRRWERTAGKQMRPYWSQPSGSDYFVRLTTELRADQRVFSLILSEPPEAGNNAHLEVAAALHAGIPAIVWHRLDCSSAHFRDAVTTMVADGALVHLPRRVTKLRHDALKLGTVTPGHPGWEIAILWDDPNRLLEPPRGIG